MSDIVAGGRTAEASARRRAGPVRRSAGWIGVVLAVPVAAYVMAVPAFVWGSAALGGLTGGGGAGDTRAVVLVLLLALLPSAVALLTWRATRTHPVRTERLLVALVVGGAVSLLTSVPFLWALALPF